MSRENQENPARGEESELPIFLTFTLSRRVQDRKVTIADPDRTLCIPNPGGAASGSMGEWESAIGIGEWCEGGRIRITDFPDFHPLSTAPAKSRCQSGRILRFSAGFVLERLGTRRTAGAGRAPNGE